MRKQITALLAAGVLTLAHTLPWTANAAYLPLPAMTLSPGNVLNVQITDENGEPIEGVSVSFTDSSGTQVGTATSGMGFSAANGSGIEDDTSDFPGTNYSFNEPWSTFEALVAPNTLQNLKKTRDADWSYYEVHNTAESIIFSEGTTDYLKLESFDPNKTADLTIGSGRWGLYVDEKWADKSITGYLGINDGTVFLNKENDSSLTAPMIDDVTIFLQPDGIEYDPSIGLETIYGTSSSTNGDAPIISDIITEYVKCRMYLPDVFSSYPSWFCNMNGSFTIDDRNYNLANDTEETAAILIIQSGAVLSAPIPDANGYIEFYVEKSTREFNATITYDFRFTDGSGGGGSGFSDSGYGGKTDIVTINSVDLPEDGVNMVYVPADTYTLDFVDIPAGYAAPKTTAITVTDSKEIQYISLTLENAFLLGDVNQDGSINAADASLVLVAAANIGAEEPSGLTAEQEAAADVNGDGTIDAVDASLILQYTAYVGSGGTMLIEEFLENLNSTN